MPSSHQASHEGSFSRATRAGPVYKRAAMISCVPTGGCLMPNSSSLGRFAASSTSERGRRRRHLLDHAASRGTPLANPLVHRQRPSTASPRRRPQRAIQLRSSSPHRCPTRHAQSRHTQPLDCTTQRHATVPFGTSHRGANGATLRVGGTAVATSSLSRTRQCSRCQGHVCARWSSRRTASGGADRRHPRGRQKRCRGPCMPSRSRRRTWSALRR
jgi:hypothetical protein